MHQTILFLFYFIFLLMGKVDFFGKKFFLGSISRWPKYYSIFSIKNEGNPKLLVYLVINGCYGVFPASIELKNKTVIRYSAVDD